MTKNSGQKSRIRAYMETHGVNYTTAKRALEGPAQPPTKKESK